MKASIAIALLAAAAVLPVSANAAMFVYEAELLGSAQNPPIVTTGTGSTTFTYDDVLHSLRVQAIFSNLIGTVTAAHMHIGMGPGTNGGVATGVPTFPGFPSGVTFGSYDATFDLTDVASYNPAFVTANGGTAAGAEAALAAGLAASFAYLNIHTTFAPGGEIRGDLAPAAAAVPEPASWMLMIAGFGLLGATLRRRTYRLSFA